jgi:hypothetical protein
LTFSSEDIYESQSDNTWWLMHDATSGRAYIRHDASPSSGGHVTEVEAEKFLS